MNPAMTDGILSVVGEWGGERPATCPWRAFFDPLVRWTVEAYSFFESGQLAYYAPSPSHRQVEALRFFHRAVQSIGSKQRQQDREQADRERAARCG